MTAYRLVMDPIRLRAALGLPATMLAAGCEKTSLSTVPGEPDPGEDVVTPVDVAGIVVYRQLVELTGWDGATAYCVSEGEGPFLSSPSSAVFQQLAGSPTPYLPATACRLNDGTVVRRPRGGGTPPRYWPSPGSATKFQRRPDPSSPGTLPEPMPIADRDLTKTYSRAQFVAKLRRLADTLEAGKPFTIQAAGEKLRIPADVTFNIEHERAGADEELEFQLLWSREE